MAVWMIAAVLAFFVKGMCGFGDGLVFGTFMGFFSGYADITPVQTLLSFPSNAILTWRNRRQLQSKMFLPVMAVLLVGDGVGAWLLKSLDTRLLKMGFGVLIVALGAEMLLRERSTRKLKSSPWVLTVIGIASGIISGLFGIGALLTAYFGRVTEDTDSFKDNICIVFTADTLFRLGIYWASGLLTASVLLRALVLLPVMIGALLGGMYAGHRLNEKLVRRIVVVMLIVSGVMLTVTNRV